MARGIFGVQKKNKDRCIKHANSATQPDTRRGSVVEHLMDMSSQFS